MRDVIVTGLPRSGLTLAAALIDTIPNSVCINHPVWQLRKADRFVSPTDYAQKIMGDFAFRRSSLLAGESLTDIRALDGAPLLDGLHDIRQPFTARGERAFVTFSRHDLTADFTLGMKQHGLYTALLPALLATKRFAVIAVVRHPLDVILSWLQQPKARAFAQGKLAAPLYPFWPEAQAISEADQPTLRRMVGLYEVFCQRYYEQRDYINILKYEELLEKPARICRLLGSNSEPGASQWIERKQRVRYAKIAEPVQEMLHKHATFAKFFYNI